MKTSIVLSTHQAKFGAVAFKGDFEGNVRKIAELGYDGVELAIRDPNLVDADTLLAVTEAHGLDVPAIGTGQAWGEEGLSFTDPAARRRPRPTACAWHWSRSTATRPRWSTRYPRAWR
jgi:sugar phosphate isomerase/epimerase